MGTVEPGKQHTVLLCEYVGRIFFADDWPPTGDRNTAARSASIIIANGGVDELVAMPLESLAHSRQGVHRNKVFLKNDHVQVVLVEKVNQIVHFRSQSERITSSDADRGQGFAVGARTVAVRRFAGGPLRHSRHGYDPGFWRRQFAPIWHLGRTAQRRAGCGVRSYVVVSEMPREGGHFAQARAGREAAASRAFQRTLSF